MTYNIKTTDNHGTTTTEIFKGLKVEALAIAEEEMKWEGTKKVEVFNDSNELVFRFTERSFLGLTLESFLEKKTKETS